VSKPKQVFSIRIDPKTLRRIRKLARKERTTIGAIVRESLNGFLQSREKKNEIENYRDGDRSGNDVGNGSGL
jgi:predicted transcriptional regulator